MICNVLKYLEESYMRFPDKCAVIDEFKSMSYSELFTCSSQIGKALIGKIKPNEPVGVYMEKGADAICAFFGIVYAGGFYSMLNTELPSTRLTQIESVLQPKLIITTGELKEKAISIFANTEIMSIKDIMAKKIEGFVLQDIHRKTIDTDPLYINFTSGSTGTPKGIVVGHRSVIDFIDCFTDIFGINSEDIIANQAPFDFDVSVKDIYSAVKVGATLVIVPRRMFSSPMELIDFLCDHKVTTLIWAVSALCLISIFHGLDYKTPDTINKVLFSGEIMPYKHLRCWKQHLPNVMFVNLYGPTEITCNCTYHILDENRDYTGGIPIGKSFPNEDVFLLDDGDEIIFKENIIGEICVRGTALALGYYFSPEQNSAHFVQNPLNSSYPETIYRTGDLGQYDKNGDLIFSGRKDFQIKYMGHRIELEEIEREMEAIDGIERCCCIFDEKKSRLKGFYSGTIEKNELHAIMEETLPLFMIPGILRRVEEMPLTKNGKIDRKRLYEMSGGN